MRVMQWMPSIFPAAAGLAALTSPFLSVPDDLVARLLEIETKEI